MITTSLKRSVTPAFFCNLGLSNTAAMIDFNKLRENAMNKVVEDMANRIYQNIKETGNPDYTVNVKDDPKLSEKIVARVNEMLKKDQL